MAQVEDVMESDQLEPFHRYPYTPPSHLTHVVAPHSFLPPRVGFLEQGERNAIANSRIYNIGGDATVIHIHEASQQDYVNEEDQKLPIVQEQRANRLGFIGGFRLFVKRVQGLFTRFYSEEDQGATPSTSNPPISEHVADRLRSRSNEHLVSPLLPIYQLSEWSVPYVEHDTSLATSHWLPSTSESLMPARTWALSSSAPFNPNPRVPTDISRTMRTARQQSFFPQRSQERAFTKETQVPVQAGWEESEDNANSAIAPWPEPSPSPTPVIIITPSDDTCQLTRTSDLGSTAVITPQKHYPGRPLPTVPVRAYTLHNSRLRQVSEHSISLESITADSVDVESIPAEEWLQLDTHFPPLLPYRSSQDCATRFFNAEMAPKRLRYQSSVA